MAKDGEYICENWERCPRTAAKCPHERPHHRVRSCMPKCLAEDGVPGSVCREATNEELVFFKLTGGQR